jgi:hypothetical protein
MLLFLGKNGIYELDGDGPVPVETTICKWVFLGKESKMAVIDVHYGSTIGLGKKYARIGIIIEERSIALGDVDELFRDSLLECEMSCDVESQGDVAGQETMVDTTVTFRSNAHVKGYGVKPDAYRASLSFPIDDVDLGTLAHFAGLAGKLTIERLGDAPVDGDDE